MPFSLLQSFDFCRIGTYFESTSEYTEGWVESQPQLKVPGTFKTYIKFE